MSRTDDALLVRTFELALSAFVVAAATGFVLRLWLSAGVFVGVPPAHLRHAHSHLMYMGWATPALMSLMSIRLPAVEGRPPGRFLRATVIAAFGSAAVAWACFLTWGYDTVALGPVELPPAAVVSGLAMLSWYAFAAGFVSRLRSFVSPAAFLWSGALIGLVIASAGAWGEAAVLAGGGGSDFLAVAFVRLFVDVFGEAWLLLAAFGLLADAYGAARPRVLRAGATLAVLAAPCTFALTMPASITPDGLTVVARLAAMITGAATLTTLVAITPPKGLSRAWTVAWWALAAKCAAFGLGGVGDFGRWAIGQGLQIPYLHVLLLAGVSVAILARAEQVLPGRSVPAATWFAAAAVLVVVSLVPMTGIWPWAWVGPWISYAAIGSALLPLLVVLTAFVRGTVGAPRPRGS